MPLRGKFLHRLDRPVVACLRCGRTDDLGRIIEKLREARERRAEAGSEGGASLENARRLSLERRRLGQGPPRCTASRMPR